MSSRRTQVAWRNSRRYAEIRLLNTALCGDPQLQFNHPGSNAGVAAGCDALICELLEDAINSKLTRRAPSAGAFGVQRRQ